MRHPVALRSTLFFIALLWCVCAFALDPSLDISQYAHTSWKVREGFAKGFIQSIAQTPDGYLWLGTEFGLLRFDGVRTVPWQPPAGKQLPGSQVSNLLVAHDGTLWIGTDKGLASWNHGHLNIYPEVSGQSITNLLEDREGTIWVGTLELPSAGKLCAVKNDGLQCQGTHGGFGLGIVALYEDSKRNLWLGVQKGFWRWKPGHSEFFPMPNEISGITGFAEDDRGTLLISSSKGLGRLVDGRVEAYPLRGLSRPVRPLQLLRDHDGGLWVATYDSGVVHVHDGKADEFSQATGLSGDNVLSLFEDREGNIWAATMNGLDRFRDYAIPSVSIRQGLSNGTVLSVLAAKDGSVWIATLNGLNRWQGGQISVFGTRSGTAQSGEKLKGSHHPESLFQDSRGRIWVSTSHEFGYLENDRFIPIPELASGFVHDIIEVGAGHLWVANQEAGLFHLLEGKVVQQIPWAGLGHKDHVWSMAADPSQKGFWLGFIKGGIAYFDDGGIQARYSVAEGLGEGRVNHFRLGPRGALWVATQGGLSRINNGHIATLTGKNGLPCDSVQWSAEDDDHAVWLYTPCGLVWIARSELEAWIGDPTITVKTTVFDVTDGVSSHTNSGGYAERVSKSPDGKIWFVGFDGLNVIDPHRLAFNKIAPPVHIEKIIADDIAYDVVNGVRLPAHVNNLDIDYTALSLMAPEKVRFRVKLEGQDKDWKEVVNDRSVHYTNLPPKQYRFRVLAANNSGVWNETGASLEFSVLPAFYQTNWFRVLCVFGFLAVLWCIYQLRVQQLRRQFDIGLEARVNERTRIARELHDTLLQNLHGVTFQFQAARNMFQKRPEEAMQTLDGAIAGTESAIAESEDAIQDLRSEAIAQTGLAESLTIAGNELASSRNASGTSPIFSVVVEGDRQSLVPAVQIEVYRIGREVLRNAFRHAEAHRIETEIRFDDHDFRLRIRDDGMGIDSKVLGEGKRAGHWGLSGLRERAEKIGAQLDLWSKPGAGTEVQLTVPGRIAYETHHNSGLRRFRKGVNS